MLKQKGYTINHKTVLKLMNELNIKGKQRKNKKYCSYKGEVGKIADNLLKRNFKAEFEKLTTDVTEFKVCDDKVYLSPVMDLYNREIISYSISLSPNLWQMQSLYFILTKVGNISIRNIKDLSKITARTQHCSKYVTKRELY